MNERTPKDHAIARKGRLVAVVIAATMLIWMAAQFVGGQLGWAPRFAFLFDLLALAAFTWALIVATQIWRARRER